MVIVPDSKIILIKNPLKLDSNNEITFADATAQYNYFYSLPKLEYSGMTYIRKDGVIRVDTKPSESTTPPSTTPSQSVPTYEDLLQYNFCMYQNTHFSNKWFYAFITDITWINPSMTEIKIETAYFQTWQFDLVFANSFIEREHVDDDTIGNHTIPEGLELGEYAQAVNPENFALSGESWICCGMTELPPAFQYINDDRMYNGIYSGLTYIVFKDADDCSAWIHACDDAGKADAIDCLFMIPKELCYNPSWISGTMGDYSFDFTWIDDSTGAETLLSITNVVTPSRLNYTYTPKNNKLFVYPFSYMNITNNAGTDVVFRYEDFKDNIATFKVLGTVTPGCSIKLIPLNYKRAYDDSTMYSFNFGMMGGKYPICSWNSDVYTNWLTQQSANMYVGQVRDELSIVGSLATGNVGGVISSFENIQDRMVEKYQHSLIPNQAKGNTNSGDVTFSSGNLRFTCYHMSIKKEYAEAIDSFFNMFGYKVNRLGTPHLHVRTYYDYIKTIEVNIEGNVPENDLTKIREMFNRGIRFWHNTSKYLDFSVNNSIINPPVPPTIAPTVAPTVAPTSP